MANPSLGVLSKLSRTLMHASFSEPVSLIALIKVSFAIKSKPSIPETVGVKFLDSFPYSSRLTG
jgi:hypothetical protein